MNRISDLPFCEHESNPDFSASLSVRPETGFPWLLETDSRPKKIHLAGLGDVGRTASLALKLMGSGSVSAIGLYDLNTDQCRRMEMELNQIQNPCGEPAFPPVVLLTDDTLFDCDIFLFCATKAVPSLASGAKDVRIAQYEANRKIVAMYAAEASAHGFRGLFGVVSDPVDLLCLEALRCSALSPYQIQGFGLGVMFARSVYYADLLAAEGCDLLSYRLQGRAFGPHGSGLVIANSTDPSEYCEELSLRLTDLTLHANLAVRALGFKPYLAPAVSSAALSVLGVIQGGWTDSAQYLGGLYFGARNRSTKTGPQWEPAILPDHLYARICASYRMLSEFAACPG